MTTRSTLAPLCIVLLAACGGSADPEALPAEAPTTPSATAPEATVAAPPAAPDLGARLVGRWEMTQEFGGGACTSLDCLGDLDPDRRPTIELRPGAYTRPSTGGGRPTEGAWEVTAAEGDTLTLGMTRRMGTHETPIDAQSVVLRDADTMEMRNAANRHGGVYRRLPDGA